MRKDLLLGSGLVLGGAASYGVLSTFVKLAYRDGYTPAEVLASQFIIGVAVFAVIRALSPGRTASRANPRQARLLMLSGTQIGLTGTFYYWAVSYTSVATAVVLLMQSVWMGVLLEACLARRRPSRAKFAACALVMAGTLLATGVVTQGFQISGRGLVYGLLSAVSYTAVIWCTSHVAREVDAASRSFLMILGGAASAILLALPWLTARFDLGIFLSWGWLIALFGTLLPPWLFSKGAPATGVGLATILSSVELPVAILMAGFVLGEAFGALQWAGVALILVAVALPNLRLGSRA